MTTKLSAPGQALIDAVRNVLEKAPEADRNALAQAIEDYARERSRAFRSIQQVPAHHAILGLHLLVEILETMIEATDARPAPVTNS
jgi:hypothetical protein